MTATELTDLQTTAQAFGLNLFGVVDARRFDRCQPADARCAALLPDCGTAIVLGTGGRGFWERVVEAQGTPPNPTRSHRPLQEWVQQGTASMQRMLSERGIPCAVVEPDGRNRLPFPSLAEAAGFGTVSPVIGALLHPRYGPWVSVRAALLLPGHPFGPVEDRSIADTFQPCCSCQRRPCLTACPTGVHDGHGGSDLSLCLDHRHAGGCQIACQVRRACPVGSDERYGPSEEQHRQEEERWLLDGQHGRGFWRRMQRFLWM